MISAYLYFFGFVFLIFIIWMLVFENTPEKIESRKIDLERKKKDSAPKIRASINRLKNKIDDVNLKEEEISVIKEELTSILALSHQLFLYEMNAETWLLYSKLEERIGDKKMALHDLNRAIKVYKKVGNNKKCELLKLKYLELNK